MNNNNIVVKGMNINNEEETIAIDGLQAKGKRNITKILNIVNPAVHESKFECMHCDSTGRLRLEIKEDTSLQCTICNATINDYPEFNMEYVEGKIKDNIKELSNAVDLIKTLAIAGIDEEDKDCLVTLLETLDRFPDIASKIIYKFEDAINNGINVYGNGFGGTPLTPETAASISTRATEILKGIGSHYVTEVDGTVEIKPL